jgi:hypothetical protein
MRGKYYAVAICGECRSERFKQYIVGARSWEDFGVSTSIFCADCGAAWSPVIKPEGSDVKGNAAVGSNGRKRKNLVSEAKA